jgi:Zn-dependent M28 family amino/carboxypeptidase
MHSKASRIGLSACLVLWPVAAAWSATFSGSSAFEYTRKAVAFGPRPVGSAAHAKLQAYILSELKPDRCQIVEDTFTARTPQGEKRMTNIIARFPGASGRIVAFTGHYDTKWMPKISFVGANDGGSSTGFLLEMAHVLAGAARKDEVYLVWLDGEEAFGEWSDTDSRYGSRHLAKKWAADGTARRIKALINVDMMGDKDLEFFQDESSTATLRRLIWQSAEDVGFARHFPTRTGTIDDDHIPFLKEGIPAVDIIDFDYGPNNSWWHTAQDTMDKLSQESFQVVGTVLMETLRRLEAQ